MKEILSEIVADAKRASDVIRSLRDLYREQKGEFRPVDINAVIHETTQLLHSEFAAQHVSPATDCGERVPEVDGNKVQLQQVLVNLIMNAGQAMGEMPPQDRGLRIVTTYDAGSVKAWVEDNGPGIESTSIEGIFEPLATWKPGGTGMGLAISNSIIEAHGGQMWAENRSEGGARVGFTLPVLEGSGTHE
jgi:signal transduction histidine kinase